MGKFVIKKSKNDQYVFNLLAANGQVICTSETYKAIDGAKNGIESVRKNCMAEIEDQTVEGYEAKKNPKYEVYTDKAGETRFRLKAANGQIIPGVLLTSPASLLHFKKVFGCTGPSSLHAGFL